MIIDGRKIAEDIYARTRERVMQLGRAPHLTIITCAPSFETGKYLSLKKKKAFDVGVKTSIIELDSNNTTEDFIASIKTSEDSDGVIVQLPLPKTVDVDMVVRNISSRQDVDALNSENHAILSPVVGAIKEILGAHDIDVLGKKVTIIGKGRLVGAPAELWFKAEGAIVSIVTKETKDIAMYTRDAEIIVCGAGVSGMLTPDMISEGVVILDAGTSEEGGELRGDADPSCAAKALLYTPVPGGIGPITIAVLLSNVVDCAERK
ncbi:MAG: bifunctional 5,10-methylenetetrahydrofolate dehydrogenase/5,10-methenyltetrahydrofolate cyclohydrolase [Candidatus Pacebacteria bacterium]|nr:bifunctional 5,10-methylenetetrahydrofolate dehydrogenase/5,10-methenyltetrahydrofolate cyclohydrolase [Candidatus Paceibacterota bacterium]MCF7856904.1 bifunctional 5,10-methylenetetrahydrofolate dehydrogenase/5,10-methenyltetrahydrofolate cyclohydrolase [Candidatus Paceibacterota bacterium]